MFSNIRNLVFDQSSPVQPVSEYRGGWSERAEEESEGRKSLFLILDYGVSNFSFVKAIQSHTYVYLGQSGRNLTTTYKYVRYIMYSAEKVSNQCNIHLELICKKSVFQSLFA